MREAILSIPDLVDLVNSAADDLGIDLDRRPTKHDDELFRDAPFEAEPQVPGSGKIRLATVSSSNGGKKEPTEDSWFQEIHIHLTELSRARTQLMDELDTIAKDISFELGQSCDNEPSNKHLQRTSSEASTGISQKSTCLRNTSIGSVLDEIPSILNEQINENSLSRVLSQIQT